jgi:hypothetical protein
MTSILFQKSIRYKVFFYSRKYLRRSLLHFIKIIFLINLLLFRGVAQLVACHVRDVEAVGSSPATPTKTKCFCNFYTPLSSTQ